MERRSLVGYSPWGRTESDLTEHALSFHEFQQAVVLSYHLQQGPVLLKHLVSKKFNSRVTIIDYDR